MYCKECGAELLDWAKVCVICGTPTELADEDSDDLLAHTRNNNFSGVGESAQTPLDEGQAKDDESYLWTSSSDDVLDPAAQVEAFPSLSEFSDDPFNSGSMDVTRDVYVSERLGNKRKGAIAVVAIAIAAIVACLMILVPTLNSAAEETKPEEPKTEKPLTTKEAEAQSKKVEVTKKVPIVVPLNVKGLDDKGSRIPVHIKGKDINGGAVDQDLFVSFDGKGIELLPGSYEVRLMCTPISEAGVLYKLPDRVMTVKISVEEAVVFEPANTAFELVELPLEETTDEVIETARTWIAKDPTKATLADTLAERARAKRNERLEEEKKKNEAKEESEKDEKKDEKDDNENHSDSNDNEENESEDDSDSDNQYYYDDEDTDYQEDYDSYQDDNDATNNNTNTSNNTDTGNNSHPAPQPADTGSSDSGSADTGSSDAGSTDTGSSDAGSADSGSSGNAESGEAA